MGKRCVGFCCQRIFGPKEFPSQCPVHLGGGGLLRFFINSVFLFYGCTGLGIGRMGRNIFPKFVPCCQPAPSFRWFSSVGALLVALAAVCFGRTLRRPPSPIPRHPRATLNPTWLAAFFLGQEESWNISPLLDSGYQWVFLLSQSSTFFPMRESRIIFLTHVFIFNTLNKFGIVVWNLFSTEDFF